MQVSTVLLFCAEGSGGNVGEADYVVGDAVGGEEAEGRAGAGEERVAVAEDDGVEVEAVLVDEVEVGESSGEVRAGYFDVAGVVGFEIADEVLEVVFDQCGVGADGGQRVRGYPLGMVSPGGCEGVFVGLPVGLVVVPVAHDLVHAAAVDCCRIGNVCLR